MFFLLLLFSYPANAKNFYKEICIKKICFKSEIADNKAKKRKGLMFREKLSNNQAMYFIFDKPVKIGFWMKNMLIDLDIIFIDRNYKIIDIKHAFATCKAKYCPSYTPKNIFFRVLEINSGLANKYNFKLGDKVYVTN
jgi:uncharacterized protein